MAALGDRYIVEELTYYHSEIRWAIWDINSREFIKDTRRYKKSRVLWKDTEDNARHHAELLNQRYQEQGLTARTALNELSRTQIVHYQNEGRRKREARKPFTSGFTRCVKCGSMVSSGHEC